MSAMPTGEWAFVFWTIIGLVLAVPIAIPVMYVIAAIRTENKRDDELTEEQRTQEWRDSQW